MTVSVNTISCTSDAVNKILHITCNQTSSKCIQLQLEAEKTRLNNRLKNKRSKCETEVDDYSDCSSSVSSASRSSCLTCNSLSCSDNHFDDDNSIKSMDSQRSCETICTHETTSSSTKGRKRITKKKVRFYPFHQTHIIEPHHNMSSKEKKNYWWKRFELAEMKPSYRSLKRMHRNCGKKDCIRGLEVKYWTLRMMKEADFRPENDAPDNKALLQYADEFLAPKQPKPNMGPESKEVIQYQEYLLKSQTRARILAHMDETYVMEHVYGLPCSHLDVSQDDRWDYLRCCSCHSSSSNQESSYFRNVMKGVRRTLSGKSKDLREMQSKLPVAQ